MLLQRSQADYGYEDNEAPDYKMQSRPPKVRSIYAKNMYKGSSQHGTTNAGLKKSNRQMNFGFDLWKKRTLSSLFFLPNGALQVVSAPINGRS